MSESDPTLDIDMEQVQEFIKEFRKAIQTYNMDKIDELLLISRIKDSINEYVPGSKTTLLIEVINYIGTRQKKFNKDTAAFQQKKEYKKFFETFSLTKLEDNISSSKNINSLLDKEVPNNLDQNKILAKLMHMSINWNKYTEKNIQIVEKILDAGANDNIPSDNPKFFPVHIAIKHNLPKTLTKLLERNPESINYLADYNVSPLFLAIQYKHNDIIKLLLDKLDKDAELVTSSDNYTTLAMAIKEKIDMASIFRVLEKTPNEDLNIQNDEDGNTALHYAAQNGMKYLYDKLVGKGSTLTLKNKKDQTAAQLLGEEPVEETTDDTNLEIETETDQNTNEVTVTKRVTKRVTETDDDEDTNIETETVTEQETETEIDPETNEEIVTVTDRVIERVIERVIPDTDAEPVVNPNKVGGYKRYKIIYKTGRF
jgi:ankyrin repeat protein